MQRRICKDGVKRVRLFVPLVLVLFMAQIFVPLAVTHAQSELEGNETAVDGNGDLTSLVDTSENTTVKAMDEYSGINISYDVGSSGFKAKVIYGKVHNYLHEMMYANMPYGLLVDGANITDAQNEILGNSSADVSANLEIAKEHYQNIITSSPSELKTLLYALMILQAA
nr:hypothetical protein, secreted [uncultured archaeon]